PVLAPTIDILPPDDWSPVDQMLKRLDDFDWIVFTSANGVNFLINRLWETGGDLRRVWRGRLAALGEGTAPKLAAFRLKTDLGPDEYRAEALAAALKPQVAGKRVLWVRASRGRDVLPTELRAAGAVLEELVVYRNLDVAAFDPDVVRSIRAGEVDWICL